MQRSGQDEIPAQPPEKDLRLLEKLCVLGGTYPISMLDWECFSQRSLQVHNEEC